MNKREEMKSGGIKEIEDYVGKLKAALDTVIREPKFLLELAGFVVLAVYAGYTIGMYYANRDAATAAQNAAHTAKDTLESIQQQFRIEQRPFITLDSVTFDSVPSVGKDVGLSMYFLNSGRTPGVKVLYNADAAQFAHAVRGDFVHNEIGGVIASGEKSRKHYVAHFGANTIGKAADTFTINGNVQYWDIFNECHVTTFCAAYDANDNVFKLCSANNEIDPRSCSSK